MTGKRFPICQLSAARRLTSVIILLASVACSRPDVGRAPTLKGHNLVIVVSDSLRAGHLGSYGYTRNTSPFLDQLAAEGVRFESAYSNSSLTRESVSALFSGLLPSHSGSYGWGAVPVQSRPLLAEFFERSGYHTGLFTTTAMLDAPDYARGMQEFHNLNEWWGNSGMNHDVTQRALEFVEGSGGERFMLYLHYLDPHGPYDPPEEFRARFDVVQPENPVPLYFQVRSNCARLMAGGFGPGEARFDDMVARYDAEILDVDAAIQGLVSGLDRLGVAGNTLVIFTADHGEEFLEHGFVEHAWTVYNESLHVPLILWAPEALKPSLISHRVSLVDLLPTLLELFEIRFGGLRFDGSPLLVRSDETISAGPPRGPVISELLVGHRNVVRSFIHEDWKYVAAQRWLTTQDRSAVQEDNESVQAGLDFDIWGPVVSEQLFDLQRDPGELHDRALEQPDRTQAFRDLVERYRMVCRESGHGPAPQRLENIPESQIERLRSLGYISE